MSDEVTRQAEEAQSERSVSREHYDWMVFDRDNWQQRAGGFERAAQQMTATLHKRTEERNAARTCAERLVAENEGLRADALAYPPQRLDIQQYANLKADYDLQATMIETLQEGLKRTETMLKAAQAAHIDDRLKGFLSVISQLADQAQDLL